MKSFKADYVFPVLADPIKNGVVTIDDDGKIIAVTNHQTFAETYPDAQAEHLNGILCPGFINTHCHLELSHLDGKLDQRTGLVEFIKNVQKFRNADNSAVIDAAQKADETMYNNGIVAVGDIANTSVTIPIKQKSKLYYHSFVETFGFTPDKAVDTFNRALDLMKEFKTLPASVTPHAPYSVSKDLFKLIQKYSETGSNLISVHNQECDDENKFYRYKLGSFNDLYAHFGIDISYFKPQARNSLQSVIPLLTNKQQILLVHNTCTNLKDIYFIKRFDRKIHFCFCPNANLYIEDKMPKIELFIGQGYNITLGTDSLASNTKLCILSEMQTIQQKFPAINTAQLIEWATFNGAKYLGIEADKGTLSPGKIPGLNLITGLDGLNFTAESKVRKIA
jgi:cytosine/adenosine deaminase-related metal-dependent hydrolase